MSFSEPEAADDALMARVRDGDREAFTVLVRRYQQPLVNFFRRQGVTRDGEDLAQETFVRVYRGRGRYRARSKFKAYLYRIARNVWIDWVRKSARRNEVFGLAHETVEQPAPGPGVLKTLEVREAVQNLPEKLRMVVVLHIYQGLKYREIAAVLGLPVNTVKSRMRLALEQLRSTFDAS